MRPVPSVRLPRGVLMPQLGFGVGNVAPDETAEMVLRALQIGYRHVDTAQMYANERQVAEGIERSGIDPGEIFVTSKLTTAMHSFDDALRGFELSARRLGPETIDLYLIHWPLPGVANFAETWRAFVRILEEGRVRAIGVSNFSENHLQRLKQQSLAVPAVNQIELHPYLTQREMTDYHRAHGIVTEAWAPLAQGAISRDDVIASIAHGHGRTAAQVILRWHIQLGNVVFPRSTNPERMRENFEIFDFDLTRATFRDPWVV